MKRVVIVSSFIPTEGVWKIVKVSKERARKFLKRFEKIEIYTTHPTVRILNLEPATERRVFTPDNKTPQIWIKPKGRLEFGKEYTLEEIERIGYDIYIAVPWEP